jgi:hypothetical protein
MLALFSCSLIAGIVQAMHMMTWHHLHSARHHHIVSGETARETKLKRQSDKRTVAGQPIATSGLRKREHDMWPARPTGLVIRKHEGTVELVIPHQLLDWIMNSDDPNNSSTPAGESAPRQ